MLTYGEYCTNTMMIHDIHIVCLACRIISACVIVTAGYNSHSPSAARIRSRQILP